MKPQSPEPGPVYAVNQSPVVRAGDELAEHEFLIGRLVDGEALADAVIQGAEAGMAAHAVLISSGVLSSWTYAQALAHSMGLPIIGAGQVPMLKIRRSQSSAHPYDAVLVRGGRRLLVLDGLARRPRELRQIVGALQARGVEVGLATPEVLRASVIAQRGKMILAEAVHGLRRAHQHSSAATGMTGWQAVALAAVAGVMAGAMLVVPVPALLAAAGLLTLPFFFVVILRVLALWHGVSHRGTTGRWLAKQRQPAQLPVYTLLVPLFDETRVLPGLVGALRQLDYPAAKLDIKLILESIDTATIEAVAQMDLGPPFEVVIVPDRLPRTKPKALNYALQLARGDFVVIYDAEDLPEPHQLREALAAFDAEPVSVGCVQGRLAIDNARASWLTCQFAIEYLALFDGLLPAFERLGLPVPLGGTSNHFRTKVLRDLGGWDAFNVTEDADLGMRLARAGQGCRMIGARTFEEAPYRFKGWLRQRTRWLKGWMQTYSVHMRSPGRLLRELGLWGFFGFHAILGGLILSALVHPIFYLGLLAQMILGWTETVAKMSLFGVSFQHVAMLNLCAGYGSAMVLALLCVVRRRQWHLVPHVLLMPGYWLLISIAAYRAVYQLIRDPFHWEKTEHGVTARDSGPAESGPMKKAWTRGARSHRTHTYM